MQKISKRFSFVMLALCFITLPPSLGFANSEVPPEFIPTEQIWDKSQLETPESLKTVESGTLIQKKTETTAIVSQPMVTVNFQNTDLLAALNDISKQTGVPIYSDGTITGAITMDIKNLPLEECLSQILLPLGYSYQKSDGYYLVGTGEFKQVLFTPEENTGSEPTVTNVFYETDLLEALQDISEQTGVPINTDGTVTGTITMEINDLPLEECLQRILFPLGYSYKKIDSYYLVGSGKIEHASFALLSATEIIRPNYLKAADLDKLISDFYRPYLKVNPNINIFAITAPNHIIEKFKQDLTSIDKPPRQIMIEALVTEISTDALKELGINWSGTLSKGNDSLSIITDLTRTEKPSLDLIYRTITKGITGDWSYTFLLPSLQALVQKGKAQIKANPKIVTFDGQQASIMVGKEQYYQIVTGQPQYPYVRLEVVKYGTSLNITPYISDKDEITVEVEPEVSDFIGKGLGDLPVLSKRTAKTQIRVKDGEKIVIGGLRSKNERVVQTKIPILGSIPILGYFFRHNKKLVEESDIIIIITPNIIKD
ncbi:MAG: type II secretion system protein GspD [Candidatus Latescibacteria bacterium]|nr:type II secretion system protein GspD [Candidatus Latescibacterota bacterium]